MDGKSPIYAHFLVKAAPAHQRNTNRNRNRQFRLESLAAILEKTWSIGIHEETAG
jgi:hypothetical protein